MRALTKVSIRQVVAVGVAAVGKVFAGAAVHGAGLGDGLDQVLIICVPPAPPADLWLAAAGNHSSRGLVPATGEKLAKTQQHSQFTVLRERHGSLRSNLFYRKKILFANNTVIPRSRLCPR